MPVRKLNPDVPANLAAIVNRTLACDPRGPLPDGRGTGRSA